jgi:hypothetical protein
MDLETLHKNPLRFEGHANLHILKFKPAFGFFNLYFNFEIFFLIKTVSALVFFTLAGSYQKFFLKALRAA